MPEQHQDFPLRPPDLVVWIANRRELTDAYGRAWRDVLTPVLMARLQASGVPLAAIERHDDLLLLRRQHWPTPPCQEDLLLLQLQAALSHAPVQHQGRTAYLQAEVHRLAYPGQPIPNAAAPPYLPPRLAQQRLGFQEDMRLACQLLADLQAGQLLLAFQSIERCLPSGATSCLYREALLRRQPTVQAAPYPVAAAIQALERLGLVWRLDRSVLWTVLHLLRHCPDQPLGCNLSALSLRNDPHWRVVLAHLEAHPDTARRLTLEITETSAVTQRQQAMALIQAVQRTGVQVALDDLGVGHSTLELLAQTRMDVIKIDRSILGRSHPDGRSPNLLRHLVQLCADFSPCIVVEGVETTEERDWAQRAGAHGIQGYLIERPDTAPAWLQGHQAVVHDACRPGTSLTALLPEPLRRRAAR